MQARKDGTCPWLRPDGKTQVTVEYRNEGGAMVPLRVHTILISTQHSPDVTNDYIHKELMEHVIKPVVPSQYLDNNTIFHLNPSGWESASSVSMLACTSASITANMFHSMQVQVPSGNSLQAVQMQLHEG